jgi:hypothetical protein
VTILNLMSASFVALTPTPQHEFRGSPPFSLERKLCTLTLIVQHIRRMFAPDFRSLDDEVVVGR